MYLNRVYGRVNVEVAIKLLLSSFKEMERNEAVVVSNKFDPRLESEVWLSLIRDLSYC